MHTSTPKIKSPKCSDWSLEEIDSFCYQWDLNSKGCDRSESRASQVKASKKFSELLSLLKTSVSLIVKHRLYEACVRTTMLIELLKLRTWEDWSAMRVCMNELVQSCWVKDWVWEETDVFKKED